MLWRSFFLHTFLAAKIVLFFLPLTPVYGILELLRALATFLSLLRNLLPLNYLILLGRVNKFGSFRNSGEIVVPKLKQTEF